MGIIKEYLNSFKKPEGAVGKFVLRGMNIGHTPLAKLVLSKLEIEPSDCILDVGCGGGVNIKRMLKKAYNGKVFGIDYSEASVKMSREKNAASLGSRCEIIHGNAANLPFANSSFDKVTAFETIYFWKDINKCFSEINRVLKNDGTFLIACETYMGGDFWKKIVSQMTVYRPERLKILLMQSGFYNIKIYTWLSYMCVTADKKPISTQKKTAARIREKVFKAKKPSDSLEYKPIYHKILTPFIKKSLLKRTDKKQAEEILKKSKSEYRRLCESSPSLGENNPFAYNAYFAYVYIAVWLASKKKLDPQTIGDIMAENLKMLKPLLGKVNLNKPGGIKFANEHMVEGYAKWYKLHGAKYPETWHINTDSEKDGIYYELRNCPICALCNKLGIPEIMPALCETDYVMTSLMHGKLTRNQTIASGGEMCDYHIQGDGIN